MQPSLEEILKNIRAKRFSPIYFLFGEEPYFINLIASELEKNAAPASGFNPFVYYGKEADLARVLNSATQFPFMAEKQLILIKDAQKLPGFDQKVVLQRLEEYARHPLESTVLAFCYPAPIDSRKLFIKNIAESGVVYQSKRLYDNKIPDWIISYCHQHKIKIAPKAIQILIDSVGNDIQRLANEIQKVLINVREGVTIEPEAIEKYVGISKDYNIFELQQALIHREALKANKIAKHFSLNYKEKPLVVILTVLYTFFAKVLVTQANSKYGERELSSILDVNPYFVKDYLAAARNYSADKVTHIISLIRNCDAALKGVENVSSGEDALLKDLIFKILH